jgi:putative transposase
MGRPPRPTAEGLTYHVLNRGNGRAVVLRDDDDRRAFLTALARAQLRYPFRLYGYCLMSNHFHLLLRPEDGVSVSRIMQSLTVAHTWRHHRRHSSSGHVWQGRFKSPVVQEESYLWTVLAYIEANPVRAGIVADPGDWPWSSYRAHALGADDPLLTPLPEWGDLGGDTPSRRDQWRRRMAALLTDAEVSAIRASLTTGRPFGSPAWSEETERALNPPPAPPRRRGRPRKIT